MDVFQIVFSLIIPLVLLGIFSGILYAILNVKPPKWYTDPDRFLAVYAISLFGAITCGILAVAVKSFYLPPNDAAHGSSISQLLGNPFIFAGISIFAVPIGVGLSPFYYWATIGKSLPKCAVFVQTIATISIIVTAPINEVWAMLLTFPIVIVALLLCKYVRFFSIGAT